jgi:hypothetical protein
VSFDQLPVRQKPIGNRLAAVLGGAVLAMCLFIFSFGPAPARAEWNHTQFCDGVTISGIHGPNPVCYYPAYVPRLFAIYGVGEQHSICVRSAVNKAGTEMCTGGPGQTVYDGLPNGAPGLPEITARPGVETSTTVHGTFWWLPEESGNPPPPPPPPPPPGPSWHYLNFGGFLTADPDICSWGTGPGGHIEIIARGGGNALYHKYWNGSFWSGWESTGDTVASGPGCVSWGANRVDIVARAADNTVYHRYWDGTSWKTDNLGGNITGDPDIASWGPNRLDVFGRAPDGSIVHKLWNGAGWSGWETLTAANTVASGAGVSASGSGGNRLDVVARAPNGSVFHLYYIGGAWGTENFGGVIKGDPDFSSAGPGNYNVWVRDTNDKMELRWWNGTEWSAWGFGGPGTLSSSPGAVAVGGRMDVVGMNPDSSLGYWYWE